MTNYDLRKPRQFENMWADTLLQTRVNDYLRSRYGVEPLFSAVNGAHLWGLQSADSDIDVHGVYLKPTLKVLDLHPGDDTIQGVLPSHPQCLDTPEIEIQFFELEKLFTMLMNNNGNVVTMLSSPYVTYFDPLAGRDFFPWIAHQFMTKHLSHYFSGYSKSQQKRAMSTRGGKALIYTYREMFSGLYLMKYGTMEFSFQRLLEIAQEQKWYPSYGVLFKYYNPAVGNLTGEVVNEDWNQFFLEWEKLVTILDLVAEDSPLPDLYDGYDLCNRVLQHYRLKDLRDRGCTNGPALW